MSYTDDAVKAKLSALNETQESIVTVSQWVMFHRRYADRTASLWLSRLKDSGSNKRLNLIYLANEVAQQSKARKKDDFLIAFSPIIAEATSLAYKNATNEIQNKVRRVVEVWRQRQIFEVPIQEAVEARIDEFDKSRSTGKKPALGGSLFSSSSGPSAPKEFQPLISLQTQLSKASAQTLTAVPTADTEYDKLTDPTKTAPTPPVYAARLSSLMKSLASAEGAVAESVKARQALLEGLEKLVEANRKTLAEEESKHAELANRKAIIENKKREVEDAIMRGLSAESSPFTPGVNGADPRLNGQTQKEGMSVDPERPDVEELTPPPPDSVQNMDPNQHDEYEPPSIEVAPLLESTQAPTPAPTPASVPAPAPAFSAGADLLSSLNMPPVRHFAASPSNGTPVTKKRRLDDEAAVFGEGGDVMADLDEDVAELLRQESGGR